MGALEDLAAREDLVNGDEGLERFDALVGKVMSVPRKEILRRDAVHKKRVAKTGNKRGPKPKPRPDVSHDPDVAPLS
jgi:hypothetical protein